MTFFKVDFGIRYEEETLTGVLKRVGTEHFAWWIRSTENQFWWAWVRLLYGYGSYFGCDWLNRDIYRNERRVRTQGLSQMGNVLVLGVLNIVCINC